MNRKGNSEHITSATKTATFPVESSAGKNLIKDFNDAEMMVLKRAPNSVAGGNANNTNAITNIGQMKFKIKNDMNTDSLGESDYLSNVGSL